MEQKTLSSSASLQAMTEMQAAVLLVESYLTENYQFRRNVLSGKTEYRTDGEWCVVTPQVMNSIVRKAKKDGIGDEKTPRKDIEEYIGSDAIPDYDPVREYLTHLPVWDGRNHVSALFNRIPGMTSEQLSWCATWLRSMVAHWLGIDRQHGNECVPVLIGPQGCGKSTFAVRLLPEHLREYYLDHINFGNKFDADMALTHNLLVNIDEFANMGASQQGKLKQTLSKVKVNGRPIFGREQQDRKRYASFLATTNDEHPLCDPTGSRRYLCLSIPKGALIDNLTPIDHAQLYAQVMHEIEVDEIPYWFGNDEVARIQKANLPFFKTDDLEGILRLCYRLPEGEEQGEWLTCKEVCNVLSKQYPSMKVCNQTKVRIGQTLKYLGCATKHTKFGAAYKLVPLAA